MTFPSKNRTSYTPSRQLIAGQSITDLENQLNSYQSLIAAGTTQADGTQIDAANVEVASGSANNAGVILPTAYPGAQVSILNNSANTTKVYGKGTDVVQDSGTTYAAAAAAVTMATLTSYVYRCIKAGYWQRFVSA